MFDLESRLQFGMAMDITVRVSDELGRRLEQFRDRLPDVPERGLLEMQADGGTVYADENAIIAALASRPTPRQVLAIRPSAELQSRTRELLNRTLEGALSRAEEVELERYLLLEHLVRVAKARALQELARAE